MALVAVIAAVGFALVAPAATASAAPPPPNPASDSSGRKPGFWNKLQGQWNKWQWQMYESWVEAAVDPHDPYYGWKVLRQIAAKRYIERFGRGSVGFSFPDDLPDLVEDAEELHRRLQETPDGLRRQVTKRGDKVHELNQKVNQAQTPAEREEAEKNREVARRQAKYVAKKYWTVKQTRPDTESVKAKIQGLDTKISGLRNKISGLEEETKKSRPDRREKLRQLKTARANLAQAEADRRRLQGPPDDDGDTGGTRTTPRDPKKPPKGPTATSTTPKETTQAKGTKGTTPAGPTTTPKGTKGTTPAGPTTTPKTTSSTTATSPRAPWKGWSGPTMPKTGYRGSTSTGIGTEIAGVIGEGIGDEYQIYLGRENQKVLEQARKDPALAKRITDDYNEIKDDGPIGQIARGFDTSKEYAQGTVRKVAPELIKSQEALDTAKAVADKSNADPLYQQARTECGGYDTCVTERTDKLRKHNAKAIAASTKKAKESNADPLYQQARTECGGYDTCVTERTDKLRKHNAKAIAASTKKAKRSNADPLYQQARKECGGYDTCVTDRVSKLRAQKKATTTRSDQRRTTDVHKTTTAKTRQTDQHKTRNAKAIAESTKKAKQSNADPLYQQARKECGGYDTCVTDRVAKLRKQNAKATTATTKTRAEQPKPSQKTKKTQSPDYRGKGGVKATAA
ncbi:hypothetical protein ACWDSL_06470 [Streptomyces sp. NPDC000941]